MLHHLERVLAVLQSSRLEGFRDRPCLEPDAPACREALALTANSTRRALTPTMQPRAHSPAADRDWPERLARAFANGFCAGPALELQQRPLDALLTAYRPAAPAARAAARASNLVSSFSLLVRCSPVRVIVATHLVTLASRNIDLRQSV